MHHPVGTFVFIFSVYNGLSFLSVVISFIFSLYYSSTDFKILSKSASSISGN